MKSAAAPEPSISRNFNGRLTAGGRSWKFRETKSRGHKETPPVTPGQRLPNGVWGTARTAWSKDARKLVLRAQRSAWPQWVYRQYDAYDLARRAAGM